MTEEILIHGKVQGYDQKPIFMIQVSAWVEENNAFRQVDRTYTDEAGIYRLPVPKKVWFRYGLIRTGRSRM